MWGLSEHRTRAISGDMLEIKSFCCDGGASCSSLIAHHLTTPLVLNGQCPFSTDVLESRVVCGHKVEPHKLKAEAS